MSLIEKCSSPTGDGNRYRAEAGSFGVRIEKCSSPTGDGNDRHNVKHVKTRELRNVVPRQGTETTSFLRMKKAPIKIEKCSSPTGDGNKE